MIGLVAAAVVGLGIELNILSRRCSRPRPSTATVARALAELDAGNWRRARDMASELRLRGHLSPEEVGGPAYVLGAAMVRDAEEQPSPRERRVLFLLAARYLQEAHQAGFPRARTGEGEWEIARCLQNAHRHAESLPFLLSARHKCPEKSAEICRLLAEAYLRAHPPQRAKALEFNRLYLSHAALSSGERHAALITQARILLEQGELTQCGQVLDGIPAGAAEYPEAMLLQGQLRMRQADQLATGRSLQDPGVSTGPAQSPYAAARDALRQAAAGAGANQDLLRKSQYLLGVCYRKLGDSRAAMGQFQQPNLLRLETPEGVAATLEVADLHRSAGEHEQALDAYCRVLRHISAQGQEAVPWLSAEELRGRVAKAYREWLESGRFDAAAALAGALAPLFSAGEAIELEAGARQAWAERLEREAASLPHSKAVPVIEQARSMRRRAGQMYSQLAELHFAGRRYADDLWASAQNYLRGQEFERSIELFRAYLENEKPPRHPPALTAIGEALLSLDKPGEALDALSECIAAHPKDPHTYRARLLAARAWMELDNLDRAEELLMANKEHESLTPRSVEWRESLYALGKLCYRRGLREETQSRLASANRSNPLQIKDGLKDLERARAAFQEAIRHLSEAIRRDELAQRNRFAPETLEARYLVAESRRRGTRLPRAKLLLTTIEATRGALNRQLEAELSQAAKGYRELQDLLNAKQEQAELSDVEERMLRNCYFAHADALYDGGQYEAAIQAYSTATNQYQNLPESLEAYVQIANCHRQLGRPAEARERLEEAKKVLARMDAGLDFSATTRYGREEWKQLLDWLIAL